MDCYKANQLNLRLVLVSVILLLLAHIKLQNSFGDLWLHLDSVPAKVVYTVVQKETFNTTGFKSMLVVSRDFLSDESQNPKYVSNSYRIQRLLNYRKLVLFAVNEMNRIIKSYPDTEECFKYWANPLNILEIQEYAQNNSRKVIYNVTFNIEPGHLPVRAIIQQTRNFLSKNNQHRQEMLLLSYEILHPNPECAHLNRCNTSTSLLKHLNKKTDEVRSEWNVGDLELSSWPPNAPMLITNYFSYRIRSFFIVTPKNQFTRFCNSRLKMLILVISAPSHNVVRRTIRKTYGNKILLLEQKVGLLFFLGTVDDPSVQGSITDEVMEFDDIVQGDFVDSYHNLTLKHLALYNWFYTFCGMMKKRKESVPNWILKVDDDYLINVDLALKIAKSNPNVELLGCKDESKEVRRSPTSKWYIPKYMYAPYSFDDYIYGQGYILQSKRIPEFLHASLTVPMIHLEDVYVTSLLAFQIGLCPANHPSFCLTSLNEIACPVLLKFSYESDDVIELWKKFQATIEKCKTKKDDAKVPDQTERCLYDKVNAMR